MEQQHTCASFHVTSWKRNRQAPEHNTFHWVSEDELSWKLQKLNEASLRWSVSGVEVLKAAAPKVNKERW